MAESHSSDRISVLFVCLGNICRSPMAEAIFIDTIRKKNLEQKFVVDSGAIIDYHVGKTGPEKRADATLKKHGIMDYKHAVRQVSSGDLKKFDWVFGMDDENISDLEDLARRGGSSCKAKIELLGAFDPKGERIIIDPYYYDGTEMFEKVYVQVVRACEGFIQHLKL